nr:Zinc finger domain containing protein [Haemonchus contortus]
MCEVTQKKRYSCRYCRFEKCLMVGMKKENSVVQAVNSIDPWENPKASSSNPGSNTSYSSCSPPEPLYRIPAIVRNENYQQANAIAVYGSSPGNFDFHSNAQMILKAKIDVLFDMIIQTRDLQCRVVTEASFDNTQVTKELLVWF